jgi:uncharacterized SAM-binding protein YcdF (DUF218 family)
VRGYEFIKSALLPGTLGLLLTLQVLCLIALRIRRSARLSVLGLTVITISYWLISTPAGAWALGRLVASGYTAVADSVALRQVRAVVVLDGGAHRYNSDHVELRVVTRASAVRALEAVRVYGLLDQPVVIVTGGAYVPTGRIPEGGALRDLLIAAGIPRERVVLDSTSRSTREHAITVAPMLRAQGIDEFALVTSAVHMRRAHRAFAGTGLLTIPAPATVERSAAWPWWPQAASLERSHEAFYEVAASLRDLLLRTRNRPRPASATIVDDGRH